MICWLAKALDARGDIGIARRGNRDDASEMTAAEAKAPRMNLSAHVCDGSMKTLGRFFVGARDQTHARPPFMPLDGRGHG
jgi:hypothetical protein